MSRRHRRGLGQPAHSLAHPIPSTRSTQVPTHLERLLHRDAAALQQVAAQLLKLVAGDGDVDVLESGLVVELNVKMLVCN